MSTSPLSDLKQQLSSDPEQDDWNESSSYNYDYFYHEKEDCYSGRSNSSSYCYNTKESPDSWG